MAAFMDRYEQEPELHCAQTDYQGQASVAAFFGTLQRLGWIDGRNLQVGYRWTAGRKGGHKGRGGGIGPLGTGCARFASGTEDWELGHARQPRAKVPHVVL